MTLIDMLRPEQRQQLRRMRYRIANREYMRRIREAAQAAVRRRRPADRGGHLRSPGARRLPAVHTLHPSPLVAAQACVQRRRDVSITAMLEAHASDNDALDDVPGAVPVLDNLSDLGDPCLRW